MSSSDPPLRTFDPELWIAIDAECARQEDHADLSVSGNHPSPRVLAVQGALLAQAHAASDWREREPGALTDTVERLAIDRCRQLFRAEHANVRPGSGLQARRAGCAALLRPGDTVLEISGDPDPDIASLGVLQRSAACGFDGDGGIDYGRLAALAREQRPRLLVAGVDASPLRIDFKRVRRIADDVGALLLVDLGSGAGLVGTGLYPNPIGVADVLTGGTDGTLRGLAGGFIVCRSARGGAVDAAVSRVQPDGPALSAIAGRAVTFLEAMTPAFRAYLERVLDNASTLARGLVDRNVHVLSGRTDSHLVMIDPSPTGIPGDEIAAILGRAHMLAGSRAESDRGPVARSLRLGSAAVTTRGFGAAEMAQLAESIADLLGAPRDAAVAARAASTVTALCRRFPPGSQPLVPPVRRPRPTLVVAR